VKSYNKTKPIRIEEFDAEKAWWGSEADGFAARVENERAWKVEHRADQGRQLQPGPEEPARRRAVSHDPDELLRRLRPPAGRGAGPARPAQGHLYRYHFDVRVVEQP
jgi:hypothetical protein